MTPNENPANSGNKKPAGTGKIADGTENKTILSKKNQKVGTTAGFDNEGEEGLPIDAKLAVLHSNVTHIKDRLDTKLDDIQTNVSIIKSKLTWWQMHGTGTVIIGILISMIISLFFSTDNKITTQNEKIETVKESVNEKIETIKESVTEVKLRNEYNAKEIDKLESRSKNSVEYNKEAENN